MKAKITWRPGEERLAYAAGEYLKALMPSARIKETYGEPYNHIYINTKPPDQGE